jgi:crossover junction endodeoxyribonuclease RuvC
MTKPERIILGVDPGTQIMGYGVIQILGKQASLVHLDIIKFKSKDDHFLRLKQIFDQTLDVIDRYHPDEMALEAPFFGKNVQSMLKLGRAQGVVMAAGLSRNIPVVEYSPRRVKQAVTGNGNASKEQVAGMLHSIYGTFESKALDASDALAVATCHFYQINSPLQATNNYSGWAAFLKQNPDKKLS